jgi:hypothetical protein
MSGLILAVSKSAQNGNIADVAAGTISCDDFGSPVNIHAGAVETGMGVLSIPIRVLNKSSSPLQLINSAGTCTCFKSAKFSGDDTTSIMPGNQRILKLEFDRTKFGDGKVSRQVLLRFKDDHQWAVALNIDARVSDAIAPLAWLPTRIDLGFVSSKDASRKWNRLTILIPRGVSIVSASCSKHLEIMRQASHRVSDGRISFEYDVAVKDTSDNDIDEKVYVQLNGGDTQQIVVPVVGVRTENN